MFNLSSFQLISYVISSFKKQINYPYLKFIISLFSHFTLAFVVSIVSFFGQMHCIEFVDPLHFQKDDFEIYSTYCQNSWRAKELIQQVGDQNDFFRVNCFIIT